MAAKRNGLVDRALSGVCFTDGYSRNCLTTFSVSLSMSCIALMPLGPLVRKVLMVSAALAASGVEAACALAGP